MDNVQTSKERILEAAPFHVAFDGWSDAALHAAARDANVSESDAKALFPRGPIDLAMAFHFAGDAELKSRLSAMDLAEMRYSARVGHAVCERIMIAAPHREAVRRGVAFFALPFNAASGAKCIWNTADTIWTALGDTSDDVNWYSKRAILSGVYSSSILFWLGDTSDDFEATRAFVDRRIGDVMNFEKFKGSVRKTPFFGLFQRGPGRILDRVRAPHAAVRDDLPGYSPPPR